MRERSFTYVLYIVLMLCFAWGGSTEGYAQRALKHRKGLLNADSIRAQNVADSLALLDTLNIRQKAHRGTGSSGRYGQTYASE